MGLRIKPSSRWQYHWDRIKWWWSRPGLSSLFLVMSVINRVRYALLACVPWRLFGGAPRFMLPISYEIMLAKARELIIKDQQTEACCGRPAPWPAKAPYNPIEEPYPYNSTPLHSDFVPLMLSEAKYTDFSMTGMQYMLHHRLAFKMRVDAHHAAMLRDFGGFLPPLPKPIFLLSLPRTGSTFFHNLLSKISLIRTIKAWELRVPTSTHGLRTVSEAKAHVQREMNFVYKMVPKMKDIHFVTSESPDECVNAFLDCSAADMHLWGMVDMPATNRMYMEESMERQYRALRRAFELRVICGENSYKWDTSEWGVENYSNGKDRRSHTSVSTETIGTSPDMSSALSTTTSSEKAKDNDMHTRRGPHETKNNQQGTQIAPHGSIGEGSMITSSTDSITLFAPHPSHMVLKSPHHIAKIGNIFEVFPTASFVWLHRDLSSVVASCCSMNLTGIRALSHRYADAHVVGQRTMRCMAEAIEHGLAERERLEKEQGVIFLDIFYDDLRKEPLQSARKVCKHAGFELTSRDESVLESFLNEPRMKSKPKHAYTLDEYGITVQDIRILFEGYLKKFPFMCVNDEVEVEVDVAKCL